MIKFCTLCSGSSGNSILASDGQTNILIDCGQNGKQTEAALNTLDLSGSNIDAILVTHEHSDHIGGIGVLSRRYDIPIYANDATWSAMSHSLGKIKQENIQSFDTGCEFEIGTLGINSFHTPHDAAMSVGYNIFADKKKLSLATDIGHMTDEILNNLIGSQMVILESNHDVEMLRNGSYPIYLKKRILGDFGHLSNDCAGETAQTLLRNGTGAIMLGHLSNENNLPHLAYETVKNALESIGAKIGSDVHLAVAKRYELSGIM